MDTLDMFSYILAKAPTMKHLTKPILNLTLVIMSLPPKTKDKLTDLIKDPSE